MDRQTNVIDSLLGIERDHRAGVDARRARRLDQPRVHDACELACLYGVEVAMGERDHDQDGPQQDQGPTGHSGPTTR